MATKTNCDEGYWQGTSDACVAGDPVTALMSHQPSSNLTIIVAGLRNGQIKLLKVHQRISRCCVLARSSAMTLCLLFRNDPKPLNP